jgi:hypothetical protein
VDWNTKYEDKGLVIIGVHTPEFEFEKEPANVQEAIEDFGIEYAVMRPTTSMPAKAKVYLDGELIEEDLVIDTDRLYTLVELAKSGDHILKLEFPEGNIELYAFTFG